MGTAFLVQVLAPYINSGARHVFPVDTPLEFNVRVKEKFSKTTTPPEGRIGSLSTAISFGEALKSLKKANKANRSPKGNKTPTKGNKSPGKSSDTDSSGSRSGGKTRRHKHTLRRHSTRR